MMIYLALLRGINVGGHKQIAMAALRKLLTQLGFIDARSLLQSGNLIFRGNARMGIQLEGLLEAEANKRLALQTHFFVRTEREWKAVLAHNPFPNEAQRDPAHLLVMFLKDARMSATWRRYGPPSRGRRSFALTADSSTSSTRTASGARV